MRKDRFGICLTFYAVMSFLLCILDQSLLCGLLLGFVILVEQDEWLTRQCMQGFFLALVFGVINWILSGIASAASVLNVVPVLGSLVSGAVTGFFGFIFSIVALVFFIFGLVGLFRVAKGRDAGVPLCKGYVDKAFGLVKTVSYSQIPMAPQAPQAPVAPQAPQQDQYQQQ